jgi:hypothetical protein
MIDSALVKEIGGNNLLDNLLQNCLLQFGKGNVLGVLGRYDNGVDAKRNSSTTILLVLDSHLRLGVGAQPREGSRSASDSQRLVEFVGKNDGQRHAFLRLVGGIAKHDTLITSTMVLEIAVVKTLSNIGTLLLDRDKDVAGLVIETLLGVVISYLANSVADDLLVVQLGVRCDFTENHDHTGLGSGFAANLGPWVLSKASIELERGDEYQDIWRAQ